MYNDSEWYEKENAKLLIDSIKRITYRYERECIVIGLVL